jgi:hypothetical protein
LAQGLAASKVHGKRNQGRYRRVPVDNAEKGDIANRVTIMAGDLLAAAAQREARQIDETLFFETCGVPASGETKAAIRRRR